MSNHSAPESWLQRWKDAEPLRLYLYPIATAVLVASLTAGWLTDELYVALTGVVSSVLMVGGTVAARRQAYARSTVRGLLDEEAEDAWRRGYARGVAEGPPSAPEQVAAGRHQSVTTEDPSAGDPTDVGTREQPYGPRRTDTELMAAQTQPREVLPWCAWRDERGRQCRLRQHPETTPHSPG